MAKRMNEFIYLHENEKEKRKESEKYGKKERVMCSGEESGE